MDLSFISNEALKMYLDKYSLAIAAVPIILKFLARINPNVPSNSIIDWLISLWPVKK
jgi:hypothetical protein